MRLAALGKDYVVIQFLLARRGGIAPPARRRSPVTLTLAEREDISRGIACGWSIRDIAKGLRRATSTVSREVARHGGRAQYRANEADQRAWESGKVACRICAQYVQFMLFGNVGVVPDEQLHWSYLPPTAPGHTVRKLQILWLDILLRLA
jgi:hypothetical protein